MADGPDMWAYDAYCEFFNKMPLCYPPTRKITTSGRDWVYAAAAKERNSEMVNQADYIVLFWNGESAGTKDTRDKALLANKPLWIVDSPETFMKLVNDFPLKGEEAWLQSSTK